MQACLDYLKVTKGDRGVVIDDVNDPHKTMMIGARYSPITSGRRALSAKLGTTNPNTAAMMVQLLIEAGVVAGDHIGIGKPFGIAEP